MIRIGILGAAGYTGGELIRVLVNHPEAEIVFAHSESNAGNLVADVHEGLLGDTDLVFSSDMPFDKVDVLFFCFGHGKSEAFLKEHAIPRGVKIIDLAQDFRIRREQPFEAQGRVFTDFVYGLPEINGDAIRRADHIANPGCFATAIQLALLPLAKEGRLTQDISVNAVTGSTGAGQKPSATTHFSWRSDNFSTYKVFGHQHLAEICQSLNQVSPKGVPAVCPALERKDEGVAIDFIPYRGDFARGIFCTAVARLGDVSACKDVVEVYKAFYASAAFTHYSDKPLDLKQVVNTNKCLVHAEQFGNKVVVTSVIDNLLKGAVGQAVQNMNLMFGLDERAGLRLKASAF